MLVLTVAVWRFRTRFLKIIKKNGKKQLQILVHKGAILQHHLPAAGTYHPQLKYSPASPNSSNKQLTKIRAPFRKMEV